MVLAGAADSWDRAVRSEYVSPHWDVAYFLEYTRSDESIVGFNAAAEINPSPLNIIAIGPVCLFPLLPIAFSGTLSDLPTSTVG